MHAEIRIKGKISQQWGDWFGGLKITYTETDETVLTGQVPDQAALYGIIAKLRDLGLILISVHTSESEPKEK